MVKVKLTADLTYWRIVRKIKCQLAERLSLVEQKIAQREAWEEHNRISRNLRNVCKRFYVEV